MAELFELVTLDVNKPPPPPTVHNWLVCREQTRFEFRKPFSLIPHGSKIHPPNTHQPTPTFTHNFF